MSIPAKRAGRKSPAVSISKKVYTMATVDGSDAEITMYGDIYEEQPTNWWGEPVEGQYILLSEFLEDLKQISGCTSITIRMNSYGGDAGASNMIHNRLRELARNGTKLTCIVDGVAMSGGSLIMCACDTVRVNPSSLIMIHKCWTFLWGGYNADELREQATQQEAWDKMQMEVYTRKTGLSATVISHMMADTTYMTGREAIDKGFADELIEDAEPTSIAASADGRSLFVNGRQMHLAPGMFAPDNIPTVTPEASAPVETDKNKPEVTGDEGGISMTKEELRAKYPDEIAQVEADARASVDHTEAVNTAIQAERARMQEIDEISGLLDATNSLLKDLEDIADVFDEYKGLPQDFTAEGKKLTELANGSLDRVNKMLADIPALRESLDSLTKTATASIDKTTDLMSSTTKALSTSYDLMNTANSVLRSVRSQADASTQTTIDSLLDTLGKLSGSTASGQMQTATNSIHSAVKDAETDLEDDTNVLNIDTSADLESVTSSMNPSPSSLQFILRTEEISVDDDDDDGISDQDAADEGVFARICNIFKKLFTAITGVFASDD